MKEKNFEKKTYSYTVLDAFRAFFMLVITICVLSFAFELILNIVAGAMKISMDELLKTDVVVMLTCLISPIAFIVFFFAYNAKYKLRGREAYSDGNKISLLPISVAIVLAIICIFLFTPLMNLIDYLFSGWGYIADNTLPLQEKMASSGSYFLIGLIVLCLLPAVAEEMIFRGIIQKSLSTRFSGFVTITLSTILFVLMHGSLQQTVYQFIVGILLGYVAFVGGSILYSIILHFLNNALVLVFSCFPIVGYLSAEEVVYYNIYSMIFPILIFLLGVSLVAILFWVLKYLRNKNFFRYEPKKKKKKSKTEPEVVEIKKFGYRNLWRETSYNERIFLVASLILVGIMWLINTIAGFM